MQIKTLKQVVTDEPSNDSVSLSFRSQALLKENVSPRANYLNKDVVLVTDLHTSRAVWWWCNNLVNFS